MTFRSFVIFAGMRTGSNLLEATLNAHDLACFGEAYNPYFIGWPDQRTLYDMTLADREAELIDAEPRPGAHGTVAFVHTRTLSGVLWELLQVGDRP